MKLISRRELFQIALAFLGLFFACFFARLIIELFVPGQTPSRVILTPLTYVEDAEQYVLHSNPSKGHGGRRLGLNRTNSSTHINSITPASSPSFAPTDVYEQILPPLVPPTDASDSPSGAITDNSAAAIVVGFAGCIIVLAALLYAYDVRERIQEKAGVNQDKVHAEIHVAEGETSAGSIGESGYWISTGSKAAAMRPILPPLPNECDSPHEDEFSISRLSTMTDSRMESPWSFGVDATLLALETSSQVTELSEEYLVPVNATALESLMSSRKDDDSLTSAGDEDALLKEGSYGEDDVTFEPLDSPRPSFEYTPTKYYTPSRVDDGCDSPPYGVDAIAVTIPPPALSPQMSRSRSSSTVDLSDLENASEV